MWKTNTAITSAIAISLMFILLSGCGSLWEEEAKVVDTMPPNGGQMEANGELIVVFDKNIVEVKVNGTSAEISGTVAKWKGKNLSKGEEKLKIGILIVNGQKTSILISSSSHIQTTTGSTEFTIQQTKWLS